MRVPRFLRIGLITLASVLVATGLGIGTLWIYLHPTVDRVDGVAYGQRQEQRLFLDVLRTRRPNGFGVLVLVSGGWKSGRPGSFQVWMGAPLLRRGYTLFAVYHVSQPAATIMQIVEDMNRAARYVRHDADQYGIDSRQLGVTGGSA